jgi:hypothetical protein
VTLAGPIVPQKSRNFCSSVRGSFAAEHNQNEADLLPMVAAARERDRIAPAALADPTAAVPVQDCAPDFAMQIAREAFHPKRSGKRAPRPNPFSVEAIFDNIKRGQAAMRSLSEFVPKGE